ncbi:aspartyl protease family protein [Adhaeribacter radiodurans]|uniref:Aspartyl protease family protein n=1 Tax=Adhaeribacter radiodurans TaxID=2745197 RepID=A0A7L7LA02_9BACT|nr:aspartyl protease family protein [Adhaeribacter radiodurans]QMU29229.1 aspartyl protease family protein [Adhaeribacter radiodurans]
MQLGFGHVGFTFRQLIFSRTIITFFIFFTAFYSISLSKAFGQGAFTIQPPYKKCIVPFQMHRNLIVVPIYVNDKGPFNFILDTGVGITLITEPSLKDSLQLKNGVNISIAGMGSDADLKAFVASGIKMKLGQASAGFLQVAVLSEDVFNLSSYVGIPIYGILGYQFFNSFAVQIKYSELRIVAQNFNDFKYRKSYGTPIPITVEGQKPYLTTVAQLDGSQKIPVKLIIDTGAGHALSLEQESNAAIKVPNPSITAQLGKGLSGTINGQLGRIKSFTLNHFNLSNVLTSFPNYQDVGAKVYLVPRNGNIGNELLKRFDVVFDYRKQLMYIRPNRYFRDPFEHDMCGLDVIASGKDYQRYIVNFVEPDSPAAEAGILPGDEVVSINMTAASSMTISSIDRLFHLKPGYNILMGIQRGEQRIYTVITLRRKI